MRKSGKSSPSTSRSTGGSAAPRKPARGRDGVAERIDTGEKLARMIPVNTRKRDEYGMEAALRPQPGLHGDATRDDLAGTLSENESNAKTVGSETEGGADHRGQLSRVRVDSVDAELTTNQGVRVSNNQSSLKAGLRGPTLLEDFVLREKITHFDHERIPERVVHARGSAAHGFFECTEAITDITKAAPFAAAGKQTPVFVRFSTVAGERGSADTPRDVRGFAVKFYTDEGNWDLVGNNIPVFFIQDAMKFPDLIHAVKPEPHNGIPQAASAHDTFWDFASLMPESTHMLMWAMSDRTLPRNFRTMQGFGVHTFRLIAENGRSTFVKFHWIPKAGTHSMVWDESAKLMGADPDFQRRDLWEAIEAGHYPEWELGLQLFSEEDAEKYSFDVLDATKLIPEELVPLRIVGRMVLNRNPDNFFAETEQVAFCTAHVVPGIDFSNDPLLAGRIHSYVDTQISRLGGPNFHEIPINAPLAAVHNNQRDGMHRQAIHRGKASYEPNSLGGGCPFQAGARGFVSYPQPVEESKLRGKPEKFGEHYLQARLFFDSQTPPEQAHIAAAFRFELSKVSIPAIRTRMLASLRNVSEELAMDVAHGLGMELPEPLPLAIDRVPTPEIDHSPALSLTARPGDGSVAARKVAILVAEGVGGESTGIVIEALKAAGAVPFVVAPQLGDIRLAASTAVKADGTLDNSPPVLFDAVVLPSGRQAVDAFAGLGQVAAFVRDQYRHCKTIALLDGDESVLVAMGIPVTLPDGSPDKGILSIHGNEGAKALIAAVGGPRHFERETDPPRV